MNEYVTFHRVIDYLEEFQKQSPILNSFGYGNLIDFSRTISGQTVNYPYMFVVPLSIVYSENITEYQVSIIFADILNYDLENEKECVSDMSLQAKRFLSYIKRGIRTFPDLYNNLDVVLPSGAIPFMERFGDHTAGVALDCTLQIFEDLNACDFYPSPTPTAEPTSTPTMTPTPTPTPTCGEITQYLKIELQDNTKFKLSLYNDQAYTSPTDALCDYPISGVAFGNSGTTYYGVETIFQGQHNKQFDLAPVLLPGEIVSNFAALSYSSTTCACPTRIELPLPPEMWVVGGFSGVSSPNIAYSYNGIDWFQSTDTFSDVGSKRVATDGYKWVMGSLSPDCVGYSLDGLDWEDSANGCSVFGSGMVDLAWNGTQWLGVGGTEILGLSNDGITWSSTTGNVKTLLQHANDVIWDGTKWIVGGTRVGGGSHNIIQSYDGESWTGVGNSSSISFPIPAYNGSIYVAGSTSAGNPLWYSNDAITWSASTNGDSVFPVLTTNPFSGLSIITDVVWTGDRFVASSHSESAVGVSYDGITWTASTNGNLIFSGGGSYVGQKFCSGLAWNGNMLVGAGLGNSIGYSYDGFNWFASSNGNSVLAEGGSVASVPAPKLYPPI